MSSRYLTFPIRGDKLTMTVKVERTLLRRRSAFQTIEVVQTESFGRMLFLDGHIQIAELDEHVYHECLVHVPLLHAKRPKRALVVGGGDGAALRELLKWPLESVVLVEIDAEVVNASREAWPALSDGAFEDPRVGVYIEDAFEFVRSSRRPVRGGERKSERSQVSGEPAYDVIVLDATDVYEDANSNLSRMLFTAEFFRDCRRLLSDDGFVVTQADNPVFCPYSLQAIRRELDEVFERSGSYAAPVPSFGGYSAFCWASKGPEIAPHWPRSGPCDVPFRFLSPSRYEQLHEKLPFGTPA